MLILSRKPKQAIKIGDNIVIYIKDIRGKSRVSLGVNAPEGMKIARIDEVDDDIYPTNGGVTK